MNFSLFPVEVKWPCDNEIIASFPLQVINSNKSDCDSGAAMLGFVKGSVGIWDMPFLHKFLGSENVGLFLKIPMANEELGRLKKFPAWIVVEAVGSSHDIRKLVKFVRR